MKKVLLSVLLALFCIATFSQTLYNIYGGISPDTYVSGDSVRIDIGTSYDGSGENIIFRLVVEYPYWVGMWRKDTIYAYRFERINDTLHSAWLFLPEETVPGEAYIEFFDPEETLYAKSDYHAFLRVISKPIIFEDLPDSTICEGETFFYGIRVIALEWPEIEWYHNGVLLEESTDTGLFIHEFSIADTGSYYCSLTNSTGTTTSRTGRLSLPPRFDKIGKPAGMENMCMLTESSSYSIPRLPEITQYSWTLIPSEAGELIYSDTSATVFWDTQFSGQAELFVKVKSGYCRGPNSDTLSITVSGPQEGPDICIVGVDGITGKNMVVWEKSQDAGPQTYILHRETNQAGVYLPLDTIETGEQTIFIDMASTPELVSQRYKLSLIDTCGFESGFSTAHKTIHLTNNMAANGNVNLIWDGYEGFAFLSYNLYHGSHADSMKYINTVPSTVFIYSNIVPFPGDNFFQIEAIHPEGCTPSLKSVDYGSSRSNILYVVTETGMESGPEQLIVIYPNPSRDIVYITIPDYKDPAPARLVDVSGQLIHEFNIDSGLFELDISSIQEGVYILYINHQDKSLKTKILKAH